MITSTLKQEHATDCEHRLSVVESWIGEALHTSQTSPAEKELHDQALLTMDYRIPLNSKAVDIALRERKTVYRDFRPASLPSLFYRAIEVLPTR